MSSEDKLQIARRRYTTPVVFLRALLDGARAQNPQLCAREETRCVVLIVGVVGDRKAMSLEKNG